MAIIQQIAAKMVEKVLEMLETDGLTNIGKAITALIPVVSETTLQIVSAYLEEMDTALCDGAKALRRQDGITVKEHGVPRTILTEIGELHYNRSYFRLKDNTFVYLLDQLIGVEGYERLSKELVASLLQAATVKSYQQAIDATHQNLSRQTVHNRLLAMKDLAADVETAKTTPEMLDVFADEDHVHLRPKGGAIVPLVTITEGMDESNPKRHKTIRPLHIAAYGMTQTAFCENVAAVLNQRYDLSQVKQINLHADGGNWIVGLQGYLPRCRPVMDGFHLEKYLRSFFRLEGTSSYAGVIRKALAKESGLDDFKRYCASIRERQSGEVARGKVDAFVAYCCSHWSAIVHRMQNKACGSCTEPMVSHILSDRLSRNPIAWSKDGLSKMTMLVVYTKNGGKVTAEDVGIRAGRATFESFHNSGYAKYRLYAKQQADEALKAYQNGCFFEPEHFSFSKVDGSYLIRKALGSTPSLSDLIA